jgi:hypothetical protein
MELLSAQVRAAPSPWPNRIGGLVMILFTRKKRISQEKTCNRTGDFSKEDWDFMGFY